MNFSQVDEAYESQLLYEGLFGFSFFWMALFVYIAFESAQENLCAIIRGVVKERNKFKVVCVLSCYR